MDTKDGGTGNQSDKQSGLLKAVEGWETRAGRYFGLADKESDVLGRKFYETAAMTLANCAAEVRGILGES